MDNVFSKSCISCSSIYIPRWHDHLRTITVNETDTSCGIFNDFHNFISITLMFSKESSNEGSNLSRIIILRKIEKVLSFKNIKLKFMKIKNIPQEVFV